MNSSVNCSLNNRNREVYLSIRELSENLRSGARTTMQGAVQTLRYPMRTGIEQQPAANASDRHGILPCTTSLRSCLRPLQLECAFTQNDGALSNSSISLPSLTGSTRILHFSHFTPNRWSPPLILSFDDSPLSRSTFRADLSDARISPPRSNIEIP